MFLALASLGWAFSVQGCSSDDTKAATNTTAPEDAGAEAAPTGETVSVLVVGPGVTGADGTAIPDVTVVLDKPGGDRVEAKTGPDGVATFTGVDWSKGKAAYTTYAEGRIPVSYVELTKESWAAYETTAALPASPAKHDLIAFSLPVDSPPKDLVTLSGTLTNAKGELVAMGTTASPRLFEGPPGSYSVGVRPGVAFKMIGVDWSEVSSPTVGLRGIERDHKRWFLFDQAALTAPEARDLDLDKATALTAKKVKGKFAIPGGDAGPLGGSSRAFARVSADLFGAAVPFGLSTRTDVAADGSGFDVEIEYAEGTGLNPIVQYIVEKSDGSAALCAETALPNDGFTVNEFLVPPVVLETSRPLTAPYTVEGVDASADTRVVYSDATGASKWMISAPPGVKSFTPPALDDAMKKAVGKPGRGVILALAKPTKSGFYTRVAFGRPFQVK